jgi:phosphoserine phosphatase RsbU/P
VIRADGRTEWLEAGGMIVGLLPDVKFECATVELEPGDLLVAYTEGISEALDALGAEFGRPRLADLVANLRAGTPEEIVCSVFAEVEQPLSRRKSYRRPHEKTSAMFLARRELRIMR